MKTAFFRICVRMLLIMRWNFMYIEKTPKVFSPFCWASIGWSCHFCSWYTFCVFIKERDVSPLPSPLLLHGLGLVVLKWISKNRLDCLLTVIGVSRWSPIHVITRFYIAQLWILHEKKNQSFCCGMNVSIFVHRIFNFFFFF